MGNLKSPENSSLKKPAKSNGFQFRYLILALCMSINAISYTMRTNINMTIVAMVKNDQNNTQSDTCLSNDNSTSDQFIKLFVPILNQTFAMKPLESSLKKELPSEDFDWSESLQGTILGAYYYGYIVPMAFGGQLADFVGTKKLITGAIALCSICTLVIPVSAYFHAYMLVAVRVVTGLAQGVVTPAIYTLLPYWIPQSQLGIAFGLIQASGNLGAVITMPICAFLSEYGFAGGWPSVFYVFGAAGILIIVPWWLFVFNSPESHPRISAQERDYLSTEASNSSSTSRKQRAKVPWGKILTSPKIWAMCVARFCGSWGNFFMMTKLPAYLKQILHMSITTNSYVNALTNIALGSSFFFWGWVTDYVNRREWFTKTVSRKLFQSCALFGSAFFLAMIPVAGCNIVAIIVMLNLSMFTLGMSAGGENLIIVDVAPDYAGSIYGITNAVASLPGFLAPLFVGVLLDQSTGDPMRQWNILFWLGAAIYALGGVVFIFGVNSKPEKWGRAPENSSENGC